LFATFAIQKARKAKSVIPPKKPGYAQASAAEAISWFVWLIFVITMVVVYARYA